MILPALLIPSLLLAADSTATKPVSPAAYEPTSSYGVATVEGWRVYVSRRLNHEAPEVESRARELLRIKLYGIADAVPGPAVAKLRQVPIWLELTDGEVKGACYHPSRPWLVAHGLNPDKARAVEIGNARHFLTWSRHQPAMVLHELAHAYHDRCLGGFGQPELVAEFRRAQQSKRYESVLYYDGTKKRAYALKNPQEYFAELTEAWFGVNDFYPFVRPEVATFDPEMAALLKKLWGDL